MIACVKCGSGGWIQSHKDILDPAKDEFVCGNCATVFHRYDLMQNELVLLDEVKVRKLFVKCDHQADVVGQLFRMLFPEWDSIIELSGFPESNKETNEILMGLFMEFDRKYHPKVLAGGIWLNHGFSSLEDDGTLATWVVRRCSFKLKPSEEA